MARPRKTHPALAALEPKLPVPSEKEVLGRNLAAAYVAMQRGIGMDYAKKRHAHEPVGEVWISLRAWSWSIWHSTLQRPQALH